MTVRLTLIVLALLTSTCTSIAPRGAIHLTLAAINDFHGNLEAPSEPILLRGADVPPNTIVSAGGIAHLVSIVKDLRAKHPNFAFVSSGDLVGATPLLAALFDDEPVIEAMNIAGLDFNGVGNHEFDRGAAHLKRLQAGGCPPAGCRSGAQYGGAKFPFLAANVIEKATGKPLFPPYAIKEFAGVKVAFIGMTTKDTPNVLSPQGAAGLEFRDEADTANALVPELKRMGVEAIVILVHEGGATTGGANECANLRGPIIDMAARMDRAIDVILSAHTHQAYICNLSGKLVTSAGSYGRFVTEVTLEIDRGSRDVIASRAVNRVVTSEIPADAAQSELIARYAKLAPSIQRVVGRIIATISRAPNRDGESRLGQLVADAHLEATRSAGAVAAFVNPGGIRAPLPFRNGGEITVSDVFTVYPFSNTLVTMTLTGAQLIELLEQQWAGPYPRVLQVSSGFGYAWDASRPVGGRIVRDSVAVQGKRVEPDADYRITVNSFIAAGGDDFKVLRDGRDRVEGVTSRDAIAQHLQARSPLAPAADRRIRRMDAAR